ncbi:Hpt domain-containing protein [Arthrobacter alpinus]|uniref:Hpt domain-containing protein n=1 Tax=Arthrobacter alpinus TaxID=656366 RepID=A0A1H5KIG2_9MICC|nr:Hpt domain-containing protein [Arthrobacter alpinus]SEE63901.1 Hpt domain-containing protein [Arthrobacter alpinus]
MSVTKLPLVCTATLHSLEESLDGERTLCRNFVCRFIEMWPGRFERIQEAVTAGHDEDAMDSALSLRSSSLMVGAARLGQITSELIRLLECGSHAAAEKKLLALQTCGNQTAGHLTTTYVNAA